MTPSPSSAPRFSTLIELLRYRAQTQPDDLAYQFLIDGKREGTAYTYGKLDQLAQAIAAQLQQQQVKGERALLLYPQGVEVVAAFCGCLYAGVIAIPVPPPDAGRLKRTLPRLREIVKDAEATLVLSNARIIELIQGSDLDFPEFEAMRWIDTEAVEPDLAAQWEDPGVDKDVLAYLQYTSGSTSTPKGVMLSHYNLLHHSAYLQRACGYSTESATVTWMPYFHDYGLVEGLIQPLYNGAPCYIMAPLAFVKRPLRWLEAIARYSATHSQAPNFAYDLCIRRIKPAQREGLDLSCWQSAGNAAEPINPRIMQEFYDAFKDVGFRWETFSPAYGLAEATLLVSATPVGRAPVILSLDANALEQGQVRESPADGESNVRQTVSCGPLVCETEVVIVDPERATRCQPNQIGEIWVADAGVAHGYWQRSAATQETFGAHLKAAGPYLRTGDLGFMKGSELYITGRIKDLIIIRGTNHYPQDIEWTVQQIDPALRPDYGASFSIIEEGEERLIVVQEVERQHQQSLAAEELIAEIRQAISEAHELQVYAIALVKSGNVLKTSSGKIQRRGCRERFLSGNLEVLADWSENPRLTAKVRHLQSEVETLAKQLEVSQS
ncbi:fatty acyl-AMP ligase [Romeria aff. gracilis LEGE 07310]|uniref:Fatty acyl-AMP ligase n=1 Tax=Vasconcelosia minhoensis LEGE 07310 TaxID=915328 RepID=A0A8J7AJS9_9CYAN|nr:fatty acyl-AMP ligase [Romeria gracilis]MBE9075924.1 fatty acyl-AMP ligase [Romeria aff. gracilis LEGE 07310]